MEEEEKHEDHDIKHEGHSIKHEEHHHGAHKHHAPKKKIKKVVMWQGATVLLGILLVASIMTGGFKCITGCSAADGEAPEGDNALIILTDERCDDCAQIVSVITPRLQEIFSSYEIKEIDYNTDEGKQIYEDTGVQFLPAVLFDESVTADPKYSEVSDFLDPVGELLSLRIGSSFDPAAEICTNGEDDNGDGLADCDDPSCSGKTICREEEAGRLDVFVMSQCPYGTQALDAMEEVLEAFGDEIDFHVQFIATEATPGTFRSLHGQPEVDENIRELCAISYYPADYKYMDYIWCRNKDIRSDDWEPCVKEAKMSTSIMRTCAEGDAGINLHSENIKLGNQLGIGASPTWLVNNKYTFSGIDAETIKVNFCRYNPGLEGCGETLSATSDVPAGQC